MPGASTNQTFFLLSPRLGFRTWGVADLELAEALWGNADVTRRIGGPFDPHAIHAKLVREIAQQREHGVQYWPIFRLADGDFVGCCGLRPHTAEPYVLELGFHLRPPFWGQGLAREAAEAAIAHAFAALGAQALFAGHHPENRASAGLLGKLGFRYDHDAYYAPTGLMHPSYTMPAPRASRAPG